MPCGQLISLANAYISEYGTIEKHFQKHVATHSYDDKAKQYETDKGRVVAELQKIYNSMQAEGCDVGGFKWPAAVRR